MIQHENILKIFNDMYKESLQQTDQYTPYHLEGDVYTHTMMVLKAAADKYGFDNIPLELFLAILLHDLGKIRTREYRDGKIYFTGHENRSVFLSIEFLLHPVIPKNIDIVKILYMINYHMALFKMSSKQIKTFFFDTRMYDLFNNIKEMTELDYLGRISCDNSKIIPEWENNNEEVLKKNNKTIDILVGVPNSGKTTLAQKQFSDYYIISRDDYIEQYGKGESYSEKFHSLNNEQQKEIDRLLMNKFHFATKNFDKILIDMTNTSIKSRKKWFKKGFNYNFHVLINQEKTILERNNTGKQLKQDVINQFMNRFQLPLFTEMDGNVNKIFWYINGAPINMIKGSNYGKCGSLWSTGKFISTVGNVSAETIKRYIEEQKGK